MDNFIITVRGPGPVEDCECPVCRYLGIQLSELEPFEMDVREISPAEEEALRKFQETGDENWLRRD